MDKKFIESIISGIREESGAHVVVIYGQVTNASASVVRVSPRHIEIDEFEDESCDFNASELVGRNLSRYFIKDTKHDSLINPQFAEAEGLRSAALFHLELKESIVVAFGFTDDRDPELHSLRLYELAQRLAFFDDCRKWDHESLAMLVHETARTLAEAPTMDFVLQEIGQLLEKSLARWNVRPNIDIWKVDHRTDPDCREVVPILRCERSFGHQDNHSIEELEVGKGIIGWAAKNRLIANVLTKQEDEELPSGERVSGYFTPFGEQDQTEAELAVPMIYQGHLVGVLNLESTVRRRFLPEHVLMAQIVAAHAAQAIHEKNLGELYDRIMGEDDLEKLSVTIAQEVGNFIEAPVSSVFLWDTQRQCLRLTATSKPFVNARREQVKTGDIGSSAPRDQGLAGPTSADEADICYKQRGVGLVRWAFENKMSLLLNDIPAYNEKNHHAHRSQWQSVSNQVSRQCYISLGAGRFDDIRQFEKPEDDRKFWSVRVSGGALGGSVERQIPQPIWCKDHCHTIGPSKSLIAVPILDIDPSLPALGVMRFSRRDDQRPFTEHDVNLIQGISRHLGQAISRKTQEQSHELEKSFIAEVVTMQPGRWDEEFQRRLETRLKDIYDVTSADAVVVWLRNNDELDYVAAYPTDEELSRQCKKDMRIPKLTYVGCGVAGRAVAQGESRHVEDHNDSYLREIREASVNRHWPDAERSFVDEIRSETAVPLVVREKVIGAMTAISFKSTAHRVKETEDGWRSYEEGIDEQQTDLLNFHARWLGPALVTIQQIVRRERQISALSIAAQELAKFIDQGDLSLVATLVIATHYRGLRFHQAVVAQCGFADPTDSHVVLQGEGNKAWGSISFKEQAYARRHRQDLGDDILNSVRNPDICTGIQSAWTGFERSLPSLPAAPCVIVRGGAGSNTTPPSGKMTGVEISNPDNGLDMLLDDFCSMYHIDRKSDAGRKMRVGMVSLGSALQPGEASTALFVTNVGWQMVDGKEEAYIDDVSCEAVDALQELARILRLAQAVPEHREEPNKHG